MSLPHPSLIGVPTETLDKIFKMLDYKEILGLRQVCKRLKNFVDIYRPDFRHKSIFVDVISNGYIVKFATDLKEEVKIEMKMKKTRKTKKMKKMTSEDGDDQMWRPLETLLAHQKSQLEAFRLRCESKKNVGVFDRMLGRIQTILTSQNRQLRAKRFETYAQNEDQIMMVLPYLDPDTLESICLEDEHPKNPRIVETPMEIGKVKECDQFKQATGFLADNVFINAKIEDFTHFRSLAVNIDTLKMSDVVSIKEKFCDYPIKNFVSIGYRNLVEDAKVPEGYTPIPDHWPTAEYDLKGYMYPIPNTKKNLQLKICTFKSRIQNNYVHIGIYDPPPKKGPLILGANLGFN
ncbi:unnamed protein product [Caenorhabditis brenneri]